MLRTCLLAALIRCEQPRILRDWSGFPQHLDGFWLPSDEPRLLRQNARRERTDRHTFLGPDTDLIGPEHRYDGCHMNESGLELHAKAWADTLTDHEKREPRVGARNGPNAQIVR
jgi:hypothetical protein